MKAGFVSILGLPNAGKSTLLNILLGEKLSIVTHKAQTTRHRIKGIITEKEHQIIFSDTPGVINPKCKLQEKMMAQVKKATKDADLVLWIVDISNNWAESLQTLITCSINTKIVIVLNKIDKLTPEDLKLKKNEIKKQYPNLKIITVSTLKNFKKEKFINEILSFIPCHPLYYNDEEMLSDQPIRFFVSEIIREKIFTFLQKEIPYQTAVNLIDYKDKTEMAVISAEIIAERKSQKNIIIGVQGSMVKKIGKLARLDIEALVQKKVFLDLHVKISPKWRSSNMRLREYGYT